MRQELFNHLAENHGITATQSQMDDILYIVAREQYQSELKLKAEVQSLQSQLSTLQDRVNQAVVMSQELAWSKQKPTEKGIYAWRGSPSIYAMVHVHKRPTQHSEGGQLNGSVIGNSCEFYNGCKIADWGGEWIGPLPNNKE